MQIGGFLAVGHALWVTRGATRVANTCGRVLLRLGPWESVFRFAQQCLVGHGAWIIQRAGSLITAPRHNHMLDIGNQWQDRQKAVD